MAQRAPVEPSQGSRGFDGLRLALLSPVGIAFVTVLSLVAADVRRFADVEPGYGFLRWNLFLAWIPLVLAYAIAWAVRREATWPALPLLVVVWIVFLPNAPYLVTDLVHLREVVNLPNAVVLSLFAVTGLLIGVKSVQLVHRSVERFWGERVGWRAVQAIAVLTALGVYLGRVLRWNSWTIILHPQQLAHAVLRSPSQPGRVGMGLLGIVVFAGAFYIAYRVLTGARTKVARLAPASARGAAES
jgi:uncharacterized membrane protein